MITPRNHSNASPTKICEILFSHILSALARWDAADYLHIWGFHETKLDVKDVKRRIPLIERLIELTEKAQ